MPEIKPISTRTPHAGSDAESTQRGVRGMISTRTPHAGSDRPIPSPAPMPGYFNPHSPCGE